MAQHYIDITISKTGEVRAHVRGVKGKGCLEYGRLLASLVGKVKEQTYTNEYYEPEPKVKVRLQQTQRR